MRYYPNENMLVFDGFGLKRDQIVSYAKNSSGRKKLNIRDTNGEVHIVTGQDAEDAFKLLTGEKLK